jgi:hypothetical protein
VIVREAFANYVSTKYSVKAIGSCAAFATVEAAEAERKRNADNIGNHQNRRKVIPTDWEYTDGAATATEHSPVKDVSGPGPAAEAMPLYHVCIAGGTTYTEGYGMAAKHVRLPLYVSDIFQVPNDRDINHADGIAFAEFLNTTYGPYFKGQSRLCGGNSRSLEQAQAFKQKKEDSYRDNTRLTSDSLQNHNIVETKWTWKGHE